MAATVITVSEPIYDLFMRAVPKPKKPSNSQSKYRKVLSEL